MYNVLIVDDDHYVRKGLISCVDWKSVDCNVAGEANNGREALTLIKSDPPDIVITDINMPEMNGIDLIDTASKLFPSIQFILLTGIYDFDNAYNAIKYRVVDLILKPTSFSQVTQVLQQTVHIIKEKKKQQDLSNILTEQQEQNNLLMQRFVLSNIISGVGMNYGMASIDEVLSSTDIHLHDYQVVAVRGNGPEFNNQDYETCKLAERAVLNCITACFQEYEHYVTWRGDSIFYIIINLRSPKDSESILGNCIELSKAIDSMTNFFVTIGISNDYSVPQMLYKAAHEAEEAAEYAIYNEQHSVSFYSQIPQMTDATMSVIRTHLNDLRNAVTAFDRSLAAKALEKISACSNTEKLSLFEVRNIGGFITNFCIRMLWDSNYLPALILPSDGECYHMIMHVLSSSSGLFSYLHEIVQCTIKAMTAETTTNIHGVVENIEKYVSDNYASDLSLKKISSVFHLSPGYLSKIFKSEKNINISTYIQNIRVNRAKELLVSSRLHSYQIAEAIGITDPVYFSKVFKKCTGMSAREYRIQYGKETVQNENLSKN